MKPLFPTFVGSRRSQIMMNGEEIEQWPICLAVRTARELALPSCQDSCTCKLIRNPPKPLPSNWKSSAKICLKSILHQPA